jgi:radical SAM superfamily enzyme YgiQ (UPF0313 family)
MARRILLVDFNMSSRFPALAIGYMAAAIEASGHQLEVVSSQALGLTSPQRDHQEGLSDHLKRRLFFSGSPVAAQFHTAAQRFRKRKGGGADPALVGALEERLAISRPDLILLSTYLDWRPSAEAVGRMAERLGIPMIVGGPMFNLPEIARHWTDLPGLTALYGGEADLNVVSLIEAALAGDDLAHIPGVTLPDGRTGAPAAPLTDLDRLPVPSFDHFPWDKYRDPVLPVLTGRGCGWGRCVFCADIATASGRTYRSRSLGHVLTELREQHRRHGVANSFFVDLKANSDLNVWRGLFDGYQSAIPGGRWVAVVHVGARGDNGLDLADLRAARAGGLARLSFGLESGSQRLNRRMAKGTTIERTAQFLEDAATAGISVRATMMLGYPGETADDLAETAAFLKKNGRHLARVRLSRFSALPGTKFAYMYDRRPDDFSDMRDFAWVPGEARAEYWYAPSIERDYRRQKREVLREIFDINRRPLADDAAMFNGIM